MKAPWHPKESGLSTGAALPVDATPWEVISFCFLEDKALTSYVPVPSGLSLGPWLPEALTPWYFWNVFQQLRHGSEGQDQGSPRLFLLAHAVLSSCSSCPSPTHCPSRQMTGSTLTSTSCVFVSVATWNGPRPGLRSSLMFIQPQRE